jgi:hypothetical protein
MKAPHRWELSLPIATDSMIWLAMCGNGPAISSHCGNRRNPPGHAVLHIIRASTLRREIGNPTCPTRTSLAKWSRAAHICARPTTACATDQLPGRARRLRHRHPTLASAASSAFRAKEHTESWVSSCSDLRHFISALLKRLDGMTVSPANGE